MEPYIRTIALVKATKNYAKYQAPDGFAYYVPLDHFKGAQPPLKVEVSFKESPFL